MDMVRHLETSLHFSISFQEKKKEKKNPVSSLRTFLRLGSILLPRKYIGLSQNEHESISGSREYTHDQPELLVTRYKDRILICRFYNRTRCRMKRNVSKDANKREWLRF